MSKKKSKHSDFYNKLAELNDKIFVYKKVFYSKAPKYEKAFIEKKIREKLEKMMRDQQLEIENFMID